MYTEIPEVNLFAFAYGLFHKDFSFTRRGAIYKLTTRISMYKAPRLSTLPRMIPEQI